MLCASVLEFKFKLHLSENKKKRREKRIRGSRKVRKEVSQSIAKFRKSNGTETFITLKH
jgi:hypothetical protein